jgi:hypothetical protein
MLLSLLLGTIAHLVIVPVPVRPAVVEIPERLAMMVRKEHKKPEPVKKHKKRKRSEKRRESKQARSKISRRRNGLKRPWLNRRPHPKKLNPQES